MWNQLKVGRHLLSFGQMLLAFCYFIVANPTLPLCFTAEGTFNVSLSMDDYSATNIVLRMSTRMNQMLAQSLLLSTNKVSLFGDQILIRKVQ